MPRGPRLAAILLALASVAACAKAQARAPDPPEPLATPQPPLRNPVPVSLDVVEPPPPEPPPAEPPAATTRSPLKTPPSPPPASPPPTQPQPQPPETPTPVLQTANASQLEQRARSLLDSARGHLSAVQEKQLSARARLQYNTAKQFVRLAEAAIVAKNFVYATQLAENANTLARLLVNR